MTEQPTTPEGWIYAPQFQGYVDPNTLMGVNSEGTPQETYLTVSGSRSAEGYCSALGEEEFLRQFPQSVLFRPKGFFARHKWNKWENQGRPGVSRARDINPYLGWKFWRWGKCLKQIQNGLEPAVSTWLPSNYACRR